MPLAPRPTKPQDFDALKNGGLEVSQNCSDISFTHPDWIVDDFEFQSRDYGGSDIEVVSANLSLTSKPTGVRALCRQDGVTGASGQRKSSVDFSCSLSSGGITDESDSTFEVSFNLSDNTVNVQQAWICHDVSASGFSYVKGPLFFHAYILPFFDRVAHVSPRTLVFVPILRYIFSRRRAASTLDNTVQLI